MDRRQMLIRLVQGFGLVAVGVVVVPAGINALSPILRGRRREVWRPLAGLDSFPPGTTRRALVTLEREDWARRLNVQAVYVWHSPD